MSNKAQIGDGVWAEYVAAEDSVRITAEQGQEVSDVIWLDSGAVLNLISFAAPFFNVEGDSDE